MKFSPYSTYPPRQVTSATRFSVCKHARAVDVIPFGVCRGTFCSAVPIRLHLALVLEVFCAGALTAPAREFYRRLRPEPTNTLNPQFLQLYNGSSNAALVESF